MGSWQRFRGLDGLHDHSDSRLAISSRFLVTSYDYYCTLHLGNTTLYPTLQDFRILSHFLLMLPLLDFAGVSQIFGGGWSQRWSFKNFNWWCQTQQTVVAKRRACQINSGQSLSFKSSTKIKIDASFMSCKCRLPLEVVLSTCFVRNIGAQPSACLLSGSELHFSTMALFLLSRKFSNSIRLAHPVRKLLHLTSWTLHLCFFTCIFFECFSAWWDWRHSHEGDVSLQPVVARRLQADDHCNVRRVRHDSPQHPSRRWRRTSNDLGLRLRHGRRLLSTHPAVCAAHCRNYVYLRGACFHVRTLQHCLHLHAWGNNKHEVSDVVMYCQCCACTVKSVVRFTVSFHISQVYPTIFRSMGLGSASSMARFGAMITPFIAQVWRTALKKTYFCCLMSLTLLIVLLQVILKLSLRVALFIYGSVCMACALLSCFLPIETKGRELKVRIIIATFHVICFLTH